MLVKKKCCHKLSLIFLKSVSEEELKRSKNNVGGQIVVALIETEINCFVPSLFCELVRFFSFSYFWYYVYWLRYLSLSSIATKAVMPSPNSFTIF